MIIRQLKLENFGVYRGEQIFDLTPRPLNGYNRPIVLLRGKNGAGKTTLMEAIRLCLHGSLALGSRVSRASYEKHLVKCIHTAVDSSQPLTSARITLQIDYVSAGRKRSYEIERTWQVEQGKVEETLQVRENDVLLSDLHTLEEVESFLRELILPGVADLFFFDGEKLHTLAQNNTIIDTLADTIKALLGLHQVEQLQKDLDVYLLRQKSEHNGEALQRALSEVTQKVIRLEEQRASLLLRQQQNIAAMAQKQHEIAQQKQRIASQGSWFVERLDNLQATRQRLEIEIEMLQRRGQELANGLLPFAIAPQLTTAVANRLRLEAAHEMATAAQTILAQQLTYLTDVLASPEVWQRSGISADTESRGRMIDEVSTILKQKSQSSDLADNEVIHRVSAEERQTLLHWIEQSQTEAPRAFCQTIQQLQTIEAQLAQVKQEIALVPDDALLSPLVETLQTLNQELGALQEMADNLTEQLRRLEYEVKRCALQNEQLRKQIATQERHNQRLQLAAKTQAVLASYVRELSQKKTGLLADQLVECFNVLCRKEDLVHAATINAETLEITLYRHGQPMAFSQLSAGERQLLAMALMWALRQVADVPLPVMVDTPLGRLDSDHRLSVIHNYFPRVSHQVILLATDTEVDDSLLSELTPAISHAYHLEYDAKQGRTVVNEGFPVTIFAQEKVEAL
ncbi:MAG: DNA sulfur modification protein DndD [Anaerolineae bacterium]|nr:DNA sulfur modification protein DndD [Anaerolineae bacterium]